MFTRFALAMLALVFALPPLLANPAPDTKTAQEPERRKKPRPRLKEEGGHGLVNVQLGGLGGGVAIRAPLVGVRAPLVRAQAPLVAVHHQAFAHQAVFAPAFAHTHFQAAFAPAYATQAVGFVGASYGSPFAAAAYATGYGYRAGLYAADPCAAPAPAPVPAPPADTGGSRFRSSLEAAAPETVQEDVTVRTTTTRQTFRSVKTIAP